RGSLGNTARFELECRRRARGIDCRGRPSAARAQSAPASRSSIARKGPPVISTRWLRQREVYWSALEGLVDRVTAHGFGALSRLELQEIGRLYRQMAADLA